MDDPTWKEMFDDDLMAEKRAIFKEYRRIRWPEDFHKKRDRQSRRGGRQPRIKPLSDDARAELREFMPESAIDSIEDKPYSTPFVASNQEPKESIRSYLLRLKRSLMRLELVLDDADTDILFELCTLAHSYSEYGTDYEEAPEEIQKFLEKDSSGPLGLELSFFRRDVGAVLKLVELTLTGQKESRGRNLDISKWRLAINVAMICRRNNIRLTKYKDGEYFRILAIVFAERYPDSGPESYRRYASTALDSARIKAPLD